MKILGIIPARGGSKGVPKKNIKLFNGKPLIAWTTDEVVKSKFLSRTIVSTDDPEIAEIAQSLGAEVPFIRPTEISGDLSTDYEFIIHALDFLKNNDQYEPDIIVRLPPTSPLRTAEHIDEGIQKLLDTPRADAVRPIYEVSKHPFKFWKISNNRKFLKPFLPKSFTGFDEPANLPRQLFPSVYCHTGAVDVIWTNTIRLKKSVSGENLAYFMMAEKDSVNIDTLSDFFIAEQLMKRRISAEKN